MLFELWVEFVKALWILIPAYAANGFPPFAQGRHAMDFGKKFFDGKRVFGEGKTWEGFFLGLIAGIFYGLLETWLAPNFNAYANLFGVKLPTMNLLVAFMLSLGALIGDLVGSFMKRRLSMPRGYPCPILDQLDFVVGATFFAYWFTEITPIMFLFMLAITPIIHRVTNIVGYMLKIKKEPW
jgi:CDP-2,3-bis-(O-geranylgeranyl)-sn-glycerol synthase